MCVRRCRRRWSTPRRVLIAGVLAVLVAGGIFFGQAIRDMLREMRCSEEESHQLLGDICRLYEEKRYVGDLCSHLCEGTGIKYQRCTNYHTGKRVLLVSCQNVCQEGETIPAVLKTHNNNFSDFQDASFSFETEDETDSNGQAPKISFLQVMVRDILKFKLSLDISESEDPIAFIWHRNYEDFYDPNNRRSLFALARSVWSLVEQSEYLMVKANQGHAFLPRIYGTCGPLYLVESAPPGEVLESDIQIRNFPWNERATLAKNILEVVRSMDEALHEPLHMCDVKGENFGVGENKQIKLIDTDTVFFDSRMMPLLSSENCSRHGDCDFFDCRGWCNIQTQHCEGFRVNNNLQSVCQDVFLGRLLDTMGGLLKNPPRAIRAVLKSTLEKCAFGQVTENGVILQKPSEDIYWSLYNLLHNSIHSHR